MPPVPLQADVLGPDYRVETFSLPPDDEGPVVATLVTLEPARAQRSGGAARARVRRLLLPHRVRPVVGRPRLHLLRHRPPQVRPVAARAPDAQLRRRPPRVLRRDRPRLVAHHPARRPPRGHRVRRTRPAASRCRCGRTSAGPPSSVAMVLNSPWFDMQGSAWLRSPATRVAIERLGTSPPEAGDPAQDQRASTAARCTVDHGGEWDYDLAWKPLESRPVYVGWLRAVRRGHAQLHAGPRRRRARPWCCPRPARLLRRADRRDGLDPRHRARRRADPPLGLLGRAGTSPRSPSRARCTTSCCRGPTCARPGVRRRRHVARAPGSSSDPTTSASDQQGDERGQADDGDHGA